MSQLAHLHRRAGFGARNDELQALTPLGYAAVVEQLLDQTKPDAGVTAIVAPTLVPEYPEAVTLEERKVRQQQNRAERDAITGWWLDRMTLTQSPLREKLTWFWHGHFATSIEKVHPAKLMFDQNVTMRTLGAGSFETLTQSLAKDGAMMMWLDSNSNNKGKPNENFARELMELFTIGIGSYTDVDVREAARAFTGWKFSRTAGFSVKPNQADTGVKNLLGTTATTGEQVITLLCHQPALARFISAKMWSQFAWPVKPDDPIVNDLAPGFAADLDITKLARAVFMHPQFLSVQAKQGLVKQPVEYVVGTLRALGLQPSYLDRARVEGALTALNQEPFAPPSVGGWPQNGYWISTATSLARLRFAQGIAAMATLDWLIGVPANGRADALAQRLGLDGWTAATASALTKASNPKNQLTVALVSPEYVLN